ncbi:MAG: hypothetical protein HZB26_13220 [Candidatus Hydrogenedentes bacterium]|nr:hypothetical protein [Candidatus Hydrogenedentota bacterium]
MRTRETAKEAHWNRREFLQAAGAATLGALVGGGPGKFAAASAQADTKRTPRSKVQLGNEKSGYEGKHDFIFPQLPAEPLRGLLLGNGDLGVSVWADGDTLVFSLGKNDVWDRRLNTSHDNPIVNLDQVIDRVTKGEWDFKNFYQMQPSAHNFTPTPKPVGQVRVTGLGAISNLCLRLADATLTFDTPAGPVTVFVEHERNVLFVRVPARAAKGMRAELFRPREPLDFWKTPRKESFKDRPTPENASDPQNAPLEPPETGSAGKAFWLRQRIPAESTFPQGFAVVVAATLSGADGKIVSEPDRIACQVETSRGPWATLAVAVRTTSDQDADLVNATIGLAEIAAKEKWRAVHVRHARAWNTFWSRSAIEINASDPADAATAKDAALAEQLFYHNLYLLACCSRPGVTATGLLGNWIFADFSPWKGVYMLNYNFQQEFWPAFICNHAELAQPYFDHITETIPRALVTTPIAFGKDAPGAYFSVTDYPFRRVEPLFCSNLYDDSMEVSAWVAQHFWRHWQFVGDREFLERRAYPLLRDVARFYEWFLHRSQRADCAPYVPKDGKLHIFPTFSPEHWGVVTPNFERNRDAGAAIAFFRYHLLAAAEAAEILNRDGEESARWRGLAQQLPEYPTYDTPDGKIFVDVAGAPPIEYNIPAPLVPVFPAEDPSFWANAEQVEIARRTARVIQTNGNNSLVMLGVIRARLGLDDSLAQFLADVRKRLYPNGAIELALPEKTPNFMNLGIWTENFAASGVIAEHLLQSHPDATGRSLLRLFPTLPAAMDARFVRLVGEGAFEVSAERRAGRVTRVELLSRRGAPCRVLNPWGKEPVIVSVKGRKTTTLSGSVLEFPTQSGKIHTLAPFPATGMRS